MKDALIDDTDTAINFGVIACCGLRKQQALALLLGLLILCAVPTFAAVPPQLVTEDGTLRGEWQADQEGVAAFLGVPFAQPPVGELRWQKPRPPGKHSELRQFTEFAPACMQDMRILKWYRDLAELFGAQRSVYADLPVSEDCLYLNVWSPHLDAEAGLPVMVWIHGGSNKSGWSYEPNYHGNFLAARGVVVVSISYRLGAFGFFSPPGLLPKQGMANFGLWDQVAALQWIQKNIKSFGGDPNRVTLFGESSGAENISALMFSPAATGLFHRAILQSTPAHDGGNMPALATEQARGKAFADSLHLNSEKALAALRRMPAEELLDTYQKFFSAQRHYPVVDGQFMTQTAWQSIDAGQIPKLQLMIGANANEALAGLPENLSEAELAQRIGGTRYLDTAATRAAVASAAEPRRALDRILTADWYLCHSQALAAAMTAAGGKAWMYYFSRVREGAGGELWGAYHGAEYPYVFNTHDEWMPTTAVDRALTEQVMEYWVEFAARGAPSGENNIAANRLHWPMFRAPDYRVIEFGDTVRIRDRPEAELCEIYRARRMEKSRRIR